MNRIYILKKELGSTFLSSLGWSWHEWFVVIEKRKTDDPKDFFLGGEGHGKSNNVNYLCLSNYIIV